MNMLILALGLPILGTIIAVSRVTDNNKRSWMTIIGTIVNTVLIFFVFRNSIGKPLPSFDLSHGQTYEVLNRFEHEGTSIVYLAPVNIRLSDCTYSRDGRGVRCYCVDGAVPTNRIVVAFTESKLGYLRPVDHGTNEFHLSQ